MDGQFVHQDKNGFAFIYVNVSKETAYRLSAYYVEKIHAAHALTLDGADSGLACASHIP